MPESKYRQQTIPRAQRHGINGEKLADRSPAADVNE